MPLEKESLKLWIGRTETRSDLVSPTSVQGLTAMLDQEAPEPCIGDPIPPCGHWLYWFTPIARQSMLGADGHPRRGGFLPPVTLPRRMWAGSRITFGEPLRVGDALMRRSRIADVSVKQGRSGNLVFVQVHHHVSTGHATALVEEQDIVYRDEPTPGEAPATPKPAPTTSDFSRTIEPDASLLFRYSALTHNGHRIHYDRVYATQVEGYPGLVVHGPLIATLLVDLLKRNLPGRDLAAFSFRAMMPLFDTAPFQVCGLRDANGGSVRLWAEDRQGALAMEATAQLR